MKKRIFGALAVSLLMACICFGCSASGVIIDRFDVLEQVDASLGSEFVVETVIVYDTNGVEYDTTYEVFCGTEAVSVSNNKFLIDKLSDYTVTYTFMSGKTKTQKSMTIKVNDTKAPIIVFNKFNNIAKNNATVKTPTIKVSDNSLSVEKSEIRVFYMEENQEITYSKADKSEFIVNKTDGYYKVVAKAYDKSNNASEKIEYIFIKHNNEIENFDYEKFMQKATNFSVVPNAEISYNSNKKYVLQGEGSMKFVSLANENVAFPEVVFSNPGIIDISEYESMSIYVFNANNFEVNLNIADNAKNNYFLKPQCWNRLEITKDNYDTSLSGKDGHGNMTGGYVDMRDLRMWIYKGDLLKEDVTLYFDNFCVNENLNAKINYTSNFNDGIYVIKDEEITLNSITQTGLTDAKINVSLVNFNANTRTSVINNKLKITDNGKYRLCFEAVSETDKCVISSYVDFVAINKIEYDANEIDNFNNIDKTYMWRSVKECSIGYFSEAQNGLLQVNIGLNKGYPAFDTDLARIAKLAETFSEFSFYVKNTGAIAHDILINTIKVATVNAGEEKTVIVNNENFKKILTAKATGNDKEIFKEGRFSIFIRNDEANNEDAIIYFDDFLCK